ncbi:MAG TPA: aldo/keto reductase [Sedimentisphaerales bacterium]|nr:aldo/keto reductase [Sedimentisphaerales bacterium]
MQEKKNLINRRNLLKSLGVAGLGSVMAKAEDIVPKVEEQKKDTTNENPQVPRRVLGKTGESVSTLALGTMFNVIENQIMLRKCLQWGVNYWDTAYGYAGGNSEIGIGKFFEKSPEKRKDVFIVSKASGAKNAEEVENCLQESLKRMNTNYIDMYYGVHVLDDISQMTDELIKWGESAKKRKLIKYFGFSTHKNMANNLMAASKMQGIDAILSTYNYRLTKDQAMQDAIQACYDAGIGITAMKTQGLKIESNEDKKLAEHFLTKGFTEGQAKIKLVLEDQRIASACVGRGNLSHLIENIAAVLDKTKLAKEDHDFFEQYAQETCNGYCTACGHICDGVLSDSHYTSEIMRYMMYHNSYGETDYAKELFAQIPAQVRNNLLNIDYSQAEKRCPQNLPIAKIIAQAVEKLA